MAKYYFNHPYFVHEKEKSINNNKKKTNPEGCEQPQPWKKKGEPSNKSSIFQRPRRWWPLVSPFPSFPCARRGGGVRAGISLITE